MDFATERGKYFEFDQWKSKRPQRLHSKHLCFYYTLLRHSIDDDDRWL